MISGIGNGYNTQNVAELYKSVGVGSSGSSNLQSPHPKSYSGPDYVNRIGEKKESDKSSLYAYENAKKKYELEKNKADLESKAAPENKTNSENNSHVGNKADTENASATKNKATQTNQTSVDSTTNLTPEEEKIVEGLKQRDREVKIHEQQHVAAGGGHASSPSYTYERGPDNRQYAVGGSVSIDVSPVAGDPEATIRKAETIRKAALAPAEPSAQDKSVAASASAMANEARIEQRKEDQESLGDTVDDPMPTGSELEDINVARNEFGNAKPIDSELENAKSTNNKLEIHTSLYTQDNVAKEDKAYLKANFMDKNSRAAVVANIYQNVQNMNSITGAVVPWGTNLNRVI